MNDTQITKVTWTFEWICVFGFNTFMLLWPQQNAIFDTSSGQKLQDADPRFPSRDRSEGKCSSQEKQVSFPSVSNIVFGLLITMNCLSRQRKETCTRSECVDNTLQLLSEVHVHRKPGWGWEAPLFDLHPPQAFLIVIFLQEKVSLADSTNTTCWCSFSQQLIETFKNVFPKQAVFQNCA